MLTKVKRTRSKYLLKSEIKNMELLSFTWIKSLKILLLLDIDMELNARVCRRKIRKKKLYNNIPRKQKIKKDHPIMQNWEVLLFVQIHREIFQQQFRNMYKVWHVLKIYHYRHRRKAEKKINHNNKGYEGTLRFPGWSATLRVLSMSWRAFRLRISTLTDALFSIFR